MHAGWPDGEPGEVAEGESFTQKLSIMGMPADVDWTVEERTGLEARDEGRRPDGRATSRPPSPPTAAIVSYEAEFSGGGIQGPMGDMVTQKAGEEIEASLAKLKALA